jgi:spore maturation protein CgeB
MRILLIEQIGKDGFYPQFFFREKGFEVFSFDLYRFYKKYIYRGLRKLNFSNWKRLLSNKIYQTIIDNQPDFVLFYNLEYIDLETLIKIKEISTKTRFICWHGDDLLNPRFDREAQVLKIPFIDIHVTPRHHLINEYYSLGAKEVVEINWFYKSKRAYPVPSHYDLSFFGSIDNKRELFIKQINQDNFILGGYGWNKTKIHARELVSHVSLERMNELISQSKVSLNFLTEANRDKTNFRNFEIPSQFSLQITERSDEINNIFNEDEGVVCFASPDEMIDKIDFYLKHQNIREKIIKNSYNIISDRKYSIEYQLDIIHRKLLEI